jgi:hypothetical protein
MEKWNSRKAGELGMNPELLSAINVAVKRGREGLTRLHESHIKIDAFREALKKEGINLYQVGLYQHHSVFGVTPSFLPIPWGAPEAETLQGHPELVGFGWLVDHFRFHYPSEGVFMLLARDAKEAFERIAECHRGRVASGGRYELPDWAEDLQSELSQGIPEFELSTSEGVKKMTVFARSHFSDRLFDSEKIEEQVESLSLELVQEDSPEWIELTRTMVSDFFRNDTAGPEIRPEKTEFGWSFVTALFPDLKGNALAHRMFNAMVEEKADNHG